MSDSDLVVDQVIMIDVERQPIGAAQTCLVL